MNLNNFVNFEDMIDHRGYSHNLSSCEFKLEKDLGLNEIRAHDLCDAGAKLYKLRFFIYSLVFITIYGHITNLQSNLSPVSLETLWERYYRECMGTFT